MIDGMKDRPPANVSSVLLSVGLMASLLAPLPVGLQEPRTDVLSITLHHHERAHLSRDLHLVSNRQKRRHQLRIFSVVKIPVRVLILLRRLASAATHHLSAYRVTYDLCNQEAEML